MDFIELGSVLADFFEAGAGPSHDQLDQAFLRTKLDAGDPAAGGKLPSGSPMGKSKRIQSVMLWATDQSQSENGMQLARQLVALIRADGMFDARLESYAGAHKIERLRNAFGRLGYSLDPDGQLRPMVIDNLSGSELTQALRSYVNRINRNPDDVPLQLGSSKELDEAAARHVLVERFGFFDHRSNFPYTMTQAFTALGLAVPTSYELDPDPHKAVQMALFLLAIHTNRLRNEAGTGHGRPGESKRTAPLSPSEARLVARAAALVTGVLIDEL